MDCPRVVSQALEPVRRRIEIVEGSHGEASVVDRAFEGADTVFWLCPPDPRAESVEKAYFEFTRSACDAIRRHGVARVVSVSALGPEDLSFNDMAQIMSEVLGRPVHYQLIALDTYKANLMKNGMSEAMAQAMADMMAAKDQGLDNAEQRTPESTTPTSFREWCEDVLKPAALGDRLR